MPTSKGSDPPPPYSAAARGTSNSHPRLVAQERSPLLSSSSSRNREREGDRGFGYSYSYIPPPSPSTPASSYPSSNPTSTVGYTPNINETQHGNTTPNQPQPPFQIPIFIYHPLYLRLPLTPQTHPTSPRNPKRTHKRIRTILLSLLGVAILATLYKSYALRVPYLSPGITIPADEERALRIAVIGAGVSGVGVVGRLGELGLLDDEKGKGKGGEGGKGKGGLEVGGKKIEVVVVEQEGVVGGRMRLGFGSGFGIQGIGGDGRIEMQDIASSSLMGDKESLIRRRAEGILGLSFDSKSASTSTKTPQTKEISTQTHDQSVGFYDGTQVRVRTTRPTSSTSWKQWTSLLWTYGASFLAARNLPTGTIARYSTLLNLIDTQIFDGIEEWIVAAGLKDCVAMGARERMVLNGVGERYREDVIEGQVRRQFAQGSEEVSDLALSLGVWREDFGGGGGESEVRIEDVLGGFLERSGAEVRFGTRLVGMEKEFEDGIEDKKVRWRLDFEGGGGGSEVFDIVVMTTPWGEGQEGYYRHVTTTIVLSSKGLKPGFFNLTSESDLPDQILPIRNSELGDEMEGIHEISHVKDVFGPDGGVGVQSMFKMYKVLSDEPLSEGILRDMWEDGVVEVRTVESPYAYPLLFPRSTGFGKFRVDEGVWSTSVIEEVASSVDLSWAAGENVANLIKRGIIEGSRKKED